MSNYLDTSDFGMVAGSLLARKKRIKNRDRNEALILSAILAGINKENQNQQEELASAIANIDVDFKLETARNQELYNNTNKQIMFNTDSDIVTGRSFIKHIETIETDLEIIYTQKHIRIALMKQEKHFEKWG